MKKTPGDNPAKGIDYCSVITPGTRDHKHHQFGSSTALHKSAMLFNDIATREITAMEESNQNGSMAARRNIVKHKESLLITVHVAGILILSKLSVVLTVENPGRSGTWVPMNEQWNLTGSE